MPTKYIKIIEFSFFWDTDRLYKLWKNTRSLKKQWKRKLIKEEKYGLERERAMRYFTLILCKQNLRKTVGESVAKISAISDKIIVLNSAEEQRSASDAVETAWFHHAGDQRAVLGRSGGAQNYTVSWQTFIQIVWNWHYLYIGTINFVFFISTRLFVRTFSFHFM